MVHVKQKYDLAFGFGPACSCSQTLRRSGLQLLSFPFDWIGPDAGNVGWDDDVRRRTDLICSEFADWLHAEDFSYRSDHPTNGKSIYFNAVLHLVFIHDFPKGVPLAESFPAIRDKYARRIARFLGLLRSSRRILVARVDRPDLSYRTPLDDCRYAMRRLGEKFPNARFDFLLLQPDRAVPFEKRTVEDLGDGITRIAFDYQDRTPGNELFPKLDQTAAAVRELFEVKDYRSRGEIAEWKCKSRAKRYAKLGASNFLQYQLRRLKKALAGDVR